jgi:hypothetical protein
MRKFALAGLALVLSVGLTLAAEVTFLGYDKEKKELKVKDGDKEEVYTVSDKTKFVMISGKKGEEPKETELDSEKGMKALERLDMSEKAKGKAKMTIELDGKKVKELKMRLPGGKKGPDKN